MFLMCLKFKTLQIVPTQIWLVLGKKTMISYFCIFCDGLYCNLIQSDMAYMMHHIKD